ncbi:hypothetical protein Molly5_189 [Maribacter phage Molly_5]|uniref:Uncharacterized protein n=1 Tax=Maribacter phage Molly_1 TaxID=2745685 RepID=A0A8E4XVE6_9CAUD|nr:hypothetical protein M1M29_gp189 [Maribacter phage Molly_1]QQO97687.1 hypothetical protein Molly2_189 [Maribacter phage Molly_2]QQO97887.1 hypothetical protein Molly3_189 [Maribacter phage Molly_3]QQO98087.1 hypothetical protein Molly4_189 [Maribacter phage Molly_4]QQO98287.1 hypothetical protein Molly5_189 [Maribacter phage Molly_5]QQO97487.1 hypothetical protein Molly1_189 [Maribacter phage Molly_1]
MKYVEVTYTDCGSREIIEIEISDQTFAIYGDEHMGDYILKTQEWSYIENYRIFNEPFKDRLYNTLNQAGLNEDQVKDFAAVMMSLQEYLFDFEYDRRMKFIVEMYILFNKARNQGADSVLAPISKQLESMTSDADARLRLLKQRSNGN